MHNDISSRKMSVAKSCEAAQHDILFCSSSCKDLSKANINEVEGLPIPSGSREMFALTDAMATYRPDIVFYENVTDLDKC